MNKLNVFLFLPLLTAAAALSDAHYKYIRHSLKGYYKKMLRAYPKTNDPPPSEDGFYPLHFYRVTLRTRRTRKIDFFAWIVVNEIVGLIEYNEYQQPTIAFAPVRQTNLDSFPNQFQFQWMLKSFMAYGAQMGYSLAELVRRITITKVRPSSGLPFLRMELPIRTRDAQYGQVLTREQIEAYDLDMRMLPHRVPWRIHVRPGRMHPENLSWCCARREKNSVDKTLRGWLRDGLDADRTWLVSAHLAWKLGIDASDVQLFAIEDNALFCIRHVADSDANYTPPNGEIALELCVARYERQRGMNELFAPLPPMPNIRRQAEEDDEAALAAILATLTPADKAAIRARFTYA